MTFISAKGLDHKEVNEKIRASASQEITLTDVRGERFIASGMSGRKLTIEGVPGNALAAYLTGADVIVNGNAQDAVGDTMNEGTITIHGNIGDAAGYAMRGGRIYVRGNAGYRAGIHMKEYKEKKPVIIIGGRCGSFLCEYQAGGIVAVLGTHTDGKPIVGNFPCTGMHGGKLYLRGDISGIDFPANVCVSEMSRQDLEELMPYLTEWCRSFGVKKEDILSESFHKISPSSSNPYKQMYVAN